MTRHAVVVLGILLAMFPRAASPQPGPAPGPPSPEARAKAREVLAVAAGMAGAAPPEVQATALMHLGAGLYALGDEPAPRKSPAPEGQPAGELPKAMDVLCQAFAAAAALPSNSEYDYRSELQGLIVEKAAEADPAEAINMLKLMGPNPKAVRAVVERLISANRLEMAVSLIESEAGKGVFPMEALGLVLGSLPPDDPRQGMLFGQAVSMFPARPGEQFGSLLSRHWKRLPRGLVEQGVKSYIDWVLRREDPRAATISVSTGRGSIQFDSQKDFQLFQVLPVLRASDPDRARELEQSRPSLKAALAQYPEGMSSLSGGTGRQELSISMSQRDRRDETADAQQRIQALSQSRRAAAVQALEENPEKALEMVEAIPLPSDQAVVLAAVARALGGRNETRARSALRRCGELAKSLERPEHRIQVRREMAAAAHRLVDDQGAWDALEKAAGDVAELYRADADTERGNAALREYWPSVQHGRRLVSAAVRLYGPAAERLLARLVETDLNLLLRLEFAAALLGRPSGELQMQMMQMRR